MKLKQLTAVLMTLVSGSLAAQDIKLSGTSPHQLKIASQGLLSGMNTTREIRLLKMELSTKARTVLAEKAIKAISTQSLGLGRDWSINGKYPASVQLGMREVPVFNQGKHATCVTFATTAAVDAIINRGDYVSQLCHLQLGNYLEQNGSAYSGWKGSFGRLVLSQMELFGIVNKEKEATEGCGGLVEYNLEGTIPKTSIDLEDYHQLSEPLKKYRISWSPILDIFQAVDRFDTDKTLLEVKNSLYHGDRVVFAILLPDSEYGTMGAVGNKNTAYDSWVLTQEIARNIFLNPKKFDGHEMVITGYDDSAIAVDENGRQHQGLLTLRNSWGKEAGDGGNFYMSYDYFKLLVIEAGRIRSDADIDDKG